MSFFSRFNKSEYARHSLILMGGTIFSMVLQTISVAWLGIYYTDEMWAVYEYFCTAYSIFLLVATGRYELAVMLPKDDNDGYMVMILAGGLSIGVSTLGGIGLWAVSLFGVNLDWVFYLPVTLAVLGIYYSCNYWLNRQKRYIRLAVNRVTQGVLFVVFNLGYAFVLPDRRFGLILGYLTAQIIVTLLLVFTVVKDYKRLQIKVSFNRIKELSIEYINFPKVSCISGIVNNLAVRLPVLLLGFFAGDAAVGQYSMMNRILGAPITVISEAIRDVFRQKASREYAANGECRKTFNTTLRTLALAAAIPFLVIFFGALPVLRLLFGSLWDTAGYFIMLMTPFYYIKFVISPLTFMTYIASRQGYDLRWQICLSIASVIGFGTGFLIGKNPYIMLLCYGIAQSILYFVYLRFSSRLSKGDALTPRKE